MDAYKKLWRFVLHQSWLKKYRIAIQRSLLGHKLIHLASSLGFHSKTINHHVNDDYLYVVAQQILKQQAEVTGNRNWFEHNDIRKLATILENIKPDNTEKPSTSLYTTDLDSEINPGTRSGSILIPSQDIKICLPKKGKNFVTNLSLSIVTFECFFGNAQYSEKDIHQQKIFW